MTLREKERGELELEAMSGLETVCNISQRTNRKREQRGSWTVFYVSRVEEKSPYSTDNTDFEQNKISLILTHSGVELSSPQDAEFFFFYYSLLSGKHLHQISHSCIHTALTVDVWLLLCNWKL